jgi:hypothetical protein
MTRASKGPMLAFFSIAAAMAVAIAAALPNLRFAPGLPLPEMGSDLASITLYEDGGRAASLPILRFIGALLGVMVGSVFLVALVRSAAQLGWKGLKSFILKGLGISALVTASVAILLFLLPRSASSPPQAAAAEPKPIFAVAPLGPPPKALVWLVAAAVACLAAAAAVLALRGRKGGADDRLRRLALEAGTARQAILEGGDLRDVITRCYRGMSLALERGRGIERESSMTAREFEAVLEEAGVPPDALRRLTRLFEAVRYGDGSPCAADEAEALRCLAEIEGYALSAKGAP